MKAYMLIVFLFSFLYKGRSQVEDYKFNDLLQEVHQSIPTLKNNMIDSLNYKIEQFWKISELRLADSSKLKYYHYKGDLAIKKWNSNQAIEYYTKAKELSNSDSELFQSHIGLGISYQIKDSFDIAEEHLLKAVSLAHQSRIKTNITESFAEIANLYREKGDAALELKYISNCLELDSANSKCLLMKANYNTKKGDYLVGLKGLWSSVIRDKNFNDINTIYALMTLVNEYIQASGLDKAEEIIALVLINEHQWHEGIISFFLLKKGIIDVKKGNLELAMQNFIKASNANQKADFQNRVWMEIYLSDPDRNLKYENLFTVNDPLPIHPSVINGSTGDFLKLMNTIPRCNSSSILESTLERFNMNSKNLKTFTVDQKNIFYSKMKEAALKMKNLSLYNTYVRKSDSLMSSSKRKNQIKTNYFLNAQLDYYENQLFESSSKLEQTTAAFLRVKKINKTYLIYSIIILLSFLMVLFLFFNTKKQKKKNQKLIQKISATNIKLEQYANEYESMLLILSHHVKKPVNQLYYSLNNLKNLLKSEGNQQTDFLIQTISDTTSELSNRISIVLSLLKYRMGSEENTNFKKIKLEGLINDRIRNFTEIKFSIYSTITSDKTIIGSYDAIAIIIDNLLENVKKYQEPGNEVIIRLAELPDNKTKLLIKNRINSNIISNRNRKDKKDSFGLGEGIVKRLCEELKIHLDILKEEGWYSTTLLFSLNSSEQRV
ncbi:GHKL domain-containing protein [uncultured Croceitalea sp.]|uniref:tetratricopeptide repeat protein n=1 Tax=uncultured Croceitalea sp. TaxID=1798908 RepID=UPI0033058CD9